MKTKHSLLPANSARSILCWGNTARLMLILSMLLSSIGVFAAPLAVGVHNPPVAPHFIIAFPQRDFVSATGYDPASRVVVYVIHPDGSFLSSDPAGIAPQPDGLVEVNHPGGVCWVNNTPDIRWGDKIQIDIISGPGAGTADATTVANVTARRPVQTGLSTVVIHGTAQIGNSGVQLPIGELEQRLIASTRDPFGLSTSRTLRATAAAGADGTLAYDAAGSINWTATYSGLSAADVTLALGAESRGMWLGTGAAGVESTIFEIGAAISPGPSAPCTAPLEILPPPLGSELVPPTDPTNLSATITNFNDVNLSWTASTDNVGVTSYGVYRNGIAVTNVQRADGLAPAPTTYVDTNMPVGTYTYSVDAADDVGNRSVLKSNTVAITTTAPPPPVTVNNPPLAPHSLLAFPSRDFISATGTPGASYHFTLIRGGLTVNSLSKVADATTGLIEVNHPGGICWNLNTPDMRPGDIIQLTDDVTGVVDQTTVANVTAERPIAINVNTVVIHGTAQDANGLPLDLTIGQFEQRLVTSTANPFELNGKRSLRASGIAGSEGTLVYDATGSIHWTATYTGLSANDVLHAVNDAESRVLWLGRDAAAIAALTELTIFENGGVIVGGPAVGCTAPAETPVASASFTPVTATSSGLSFPSTAFAPTPATSPAQTVTFSNSGGAPMTLTNIYFAGLNPGDFLRAGGTCPTAFPATLAAGASCTVNIAFKPTAVGSRQANLSFSDNAANTTYQTIPLTGTGLGVTTPNIIVSPTSLAFGTVNAGASSTQSITVSNTGTGPLNISAISANLADFAVTSQTCTAASVSAPSGTCTISVRFSPLGLGARTAALTLSHNETGNGTTSTVIPLSGTGAGSVLSFTSNPVTFGTVNRNTTKDQTISVKNSGTAAAALNLGSFSVTGTGYSVRSTTCAALATGRSCNVVVRFTAPNTVGSFPGTLSVTAPNALPTKATTNLTATTK